MRSVIVNHIGLLSQPNLKSPSPWINKKKSLLGFLENNRKLQKKLFQASFLKRAIKSFSVTTHLYRGIILNIRKSLSRVTTDYIKHFLWHHVLLLLWHWILDSTKNPWINKLIPILATEFWQLFHLTPEYWFNSDLHSISNRFPYWPS